ncbi:MAG: hypothetical protein ACOYMA_09965 [Bacteroidia bacterium]
MQKTITKIATKPLECPVPHGKRWKWLGYVKKLGFWGFMFFLVKGVLLYIVLPYLAAKGIFNW